jgi:hypothetical protein
VVGDGAILPVEGGELLERAVEDFDFAGGGDVADAAGLLTNEFESGFAGGTGGWVFENCAMACEVAPRVANQVKSEGFLVASKVENASGAARVAVVEFAVENLGGKAEGHGNESVLAGLYGEGLRFSFTGGGEEWLGLFGEIGGGEGFGGAVFFCGEGAECGDAGELLGREWRAEGFACGGNEGAGSPALDGDHTGGGEIFQGIPS